MIFYSGFSLINDLYFFDDFLEKSDYTIAGFSYGAIKAALYTAESSNRIDTLQLFSPAFFQTKKESFKRLQLAGFSKSPDEYRENFLLTCFSPYHVGDVQCDSTSNEAQLRELLYFEWSNDLMMSIINKGTRIEVYLGLEDRVIDVAAARDFFISYATVTSIRKGNHFLQEYQ
jgi:pimeloyl-ACP methyl ester carboxylesterase